MIVLFTIARGNSFPVMSVAFSLLMKSNFSSKYLRFKWVSVIEAHFLKQLTSVSYINQIYIGDNKIYCTYDSIENNEYREQLVRAAYSPLNNAVLKNQLSHS